MTGQSVWTLEVLGVPVSASGSLVNERQVGTIFYCFSVNWYLTGRQVIGIKWSRPSVLTGQVVSTYVRISIRVCFGRRRHLIKWALLTARLRISNSNALSIAGTVCFAEPERKPLPAGGGGGSWELTSGTGNWHATLLSFDRAGRIKSAFHDSFNVPDSTGSRTRGPGNEGTKFLWLPHTVFSFPLPLNYMGLYGYMFGLTWSLSYQMTRTFFVWW
jgi:hypothetical protein